VSKAMVPQFSQFEKKDLKSLVEVVGEANISTEHGIGVEKKQFMQLEHGDSFKIMKGIKKLLDPDNIMNPGKIFDL
jgi:FAD/FMN-containing dehydrogenase